MITYSSLDIYTIHLLTRANNAISTTNTKTAESLLIDHEIFQLRSLRAFQLSSKEMQAMLSVSAPC